MSTSTNDAVKGGEQPAKPPTRFATNPPTDDATDGGALADDRLRSYFASYSAGTPSSRGQEPGPGPSPDIAELEADMAAFRDIANAPAGDLANPEV
ncbi:hypothetical protein SAPIO_CDS2306 [Scedosporium apiospermum]|uniref:Uncharacterized protein n=1 Tax=Pseudallescheria apiosperma TaxID=563466 RepID=A0A084GC76_PSEDA|nr:uncharacterized protein SAPIO_CDS2306 [Scedosporium apiospermum]KEZ44938.1 hypothetical protein SAPIO_CDS2306 [Scedosporium apiospermum]